MPGIDDEGGQGAAVDNLCQLAFTLADDQLRVPQIGDVAADAVVAHEVALVVKAGCAAD